jgi:hypothetical protein
LHAAVPHVPPEQDWPFGQTFPHAPQLLRSESVTVHVPLHVVHGVVLSFGGVVVVLVEQAKIQAAKRSSGTA